MCKYLGVYIDQNLKFREHIDYVVKNSIHSVDYQKNLLLFSSLFAKSIIMDGILAYGSAAKAKLKSIEQVQRRILEEIFVMHRMNDTQ